MPRPRVNLTRYHGLFAPNSRWRALITPAGRGRRKPADANQPGSKPHVAMTWARRLKRVFRTEIETCEHCGGAVRIVASIERPAVIDKILVHIDRRNRAGANPHAPRAPPVTRTDQLDLGNPFSRAVLIQGTAAEFFVCCT